MTPQGKRSLTKLRTLTRRLEDEYLEPLDEQERATLHALLLRLAERHEPGCAPPTEPR